MKKILYVALLLFFVTCGMAQTEIVDSLLNVLNTKKNSHKEELQLYKEICLEFIYNNTKKLEEFSRKGAERAAKYGEKQYLMWFYCSIAESYSVGGDVTNTFTYLNKAYEVAEKEKDEAYKAWIKMNMANAYMAAGNDDKAIESYMDALPYVEKNNQLQYANILHNIGSIHSSHKDYDRAILYFNKSDSIEKLLGLEENMYILYDRGVIYMARGEYDKALECFSKSLERSRKKEDKGLEINSLQTLSQLYAIDYNDYDKGIEYGKLSLNLTREYGEKRNLPMSWLVLSNIYRKYGKYEECEYSALQALELKSENFALVLNALDNVTYSNILLGNKDKATDFLDKMYNYMNDGMENNAHDVLLDMEVKYETEKKELQIAALENEKKLYIWLGIAGVLFTLALGFVLWLTIRNTKKEKQLIATRSVMDGEMKERTRLARDLHDRLSGNLSAVKIGLSDEEQSMKYVGDKLDTCIEEVRHIAHNLMPASLQYGLKVALEDFAAQFPNVDFHFFGDEGRFDDRAEFVLYCCANELVNNSLRHAEAEHVNMQLVQADKHITLTVQDDGKGYEEKNITEGMGLKNIRDRVTSYSGKIDIVSSEGKGTETTIELKVARI